MAFERLPIGRPVQSVEVATPHTFSFGTLGFQIFLGIQFKGFATRFMAEPVAVPLEVGDQSCTPWINLHATNGIHLGTSGGCCLLHDCPFIFSVLLLCTQEACHFVAQKLNSLLTHALLDFKSI